MARDMLESEGQWVEEWTEEKVRFFQSFESIQASVYRTAILKGWHGEDGDAPLNMGNFISNLHSEVSEAWDAYARGNRASEKIEGYSKIEEELADVIIRIMDSAAVQGWDIAGAIIEKAEFNKSRSYRHGGKRA